CEGEPPCVYCTKKRQKCVPQAADPKTDTVFINTCAASLSQKCDDPASFGKRKISRLPDPTPKLYLTVPLDDSALFVGHFFSGFLAANQFGGTLDIDTIVSQFQSSASLYQVSIAVGALDISNKSGRTRIERSEAKLGALNAYRICVVTLRNEISNREIKQSDACLWTTFFLGLFELMYDDTGEGFVKHFLHGTSKILQLRGPGAHLEGTGRSFFLTVRVLEICRALIYSNYSEPTFLCQNDWVEVTKRIWDAIEDLHPKEHLFDLMVCCSSLSDRVGYALETSSNITSTDLHSILEQFASEGLSLRLSLDEWHRTFQEWILSDDNPSDAGQSILANLYFHAISIFLSGIFDYRFEFNHLVAPRLLENQIQYHVSSILLETEIALRTTDLAGVLYFFPLRVAGARITSREEGAAIVAMLEKISWRSFIVAGAFVSDLKTVWLKKGLRNEFKAQK
ncbi:Uncharacterized protein D0Z07_6868, partial [Hyphodiscus hymeniophilus]